MRVVTDLNELRRARLALTEPLGFVPTMGYLHEGHLSLVQRAKEECASVIISVFVNPAQFGPHEDFERYPRTLDHDLHMLKDLNPDLVWAPSVGTIYPEGFQTYINVERMSLPLEGTVRPGHFRGVATVVAKLFNQVQPQYAYFGQKDAQQLTVIRRMALDLNMPVHIVACPIIREADGLAMSSRNGYLNPNERRAAVILHQALEAARLAYNRGERQPETLKSAMRKIILNEPLARIDYVSISRPETLVELDVLGPNALFSLAVRIGSTRLIDNFLLEAGRWQTGRLSSGSLSYAAGH